MRKVLFGQEIGGMLILSFALLTNGCFDWECTVSGVQEMSGLAGNQKVIAYVRNCGATSDYTVNVSFVEPGRDIKKEPGEIFFANHGHEIVLEKISPDSVKIIYFAPDILKKKSKMNGINFIYEESGRKRSQE